VDLRAGQDLEGAISVLALTASISNPARA
jgi:hypothetical protein